MAMQNYEVRLLKQDGSAALVYMTIGQSDAEVKARLQAISGVTFVRFEIWRGGLLAACGPAQ